MNLENPRMAGSSTTYQWLSWFHKIYNCWKLCATLEKRPEQPAYVSEELPPAVNLLSSPEVTQTDPQHMCNGCLQRLDQSRQEHQSRLWELTSPLSHFNFVKHEFSGTAYFIAELTLPETEEPQPGRLEDFILYCMCFDVYFKGFSQSGVLRVLSVPRQMKTSISLHNETAFHEI